MKLVPAKQKRVAMSTSVSKNELTIDGFATQDPLVVASFTQERDEGTSLDEYVEQVLRVGVQVLGVASASVGVERLASGINLAEKSMTEASAKFNDELNKKIAELTAEDGKLSSLVDGAFKGFTADIQKLTAGEDSPIREGIKKQMTDLAAKLVDDFARESTRQKEEIAKLLDPANAGSPMRQLAVQLEGVAKAVAEVQTEMGKEVAVAEIIDNSTHGGVPYEDSVVSVVQQIANLAGDDCEATGDKVGLMPRRKSGDGVVSLKQGDSIKARIVLEAKNSALDRKEWEKEIKDSKENRDAAGFIGFAKHSNYLPNGGRVQIIDRQTVLVAYDPAIDDPQIVALVYHIVKMNTLALAGTIDEDIVRIVNDHLDQAMSHFKKFDQLKKDIRQVENLSKSIHSNVSFLQVEIQNHLGAIQSAVSPALTELEMARDESPALESGTDND
jgi:hypothetical protein